MMLPLRPVVAFGLRWVGLRTLVAGLRRAPWIAFRVAADATCLERSLAELHALSRSGTTASLALGVRRRDGRLEAHAWVERAGQVVEECEGFRRLGAL